VSGSCTDKAGNTASASFGLKYDSTPPAVTAATPDRAADSDGWYNHAVTVTFAGTDATSGIASCDKPTYSKDAATASVTGTCTDNAGNVSAPGSFVLKYDSTPPKLGGLEVSSLDKSATLSWTASADVTQVTIVRTGGGGQPDTVYKGKRVTTFTDQTVRNGNKYTYAVTAFDDAGNAVVVKGLATPSAPLLAPRAAAHVRSGVTFRWRPVKGATYYNVQLWLKGRKVLTTWPTSTTLHVPRLERGKYTWLVWPGKGKRQAHRYGPLIGSSTFVVTG
jgi:hypothetical protein